MTDVYLKPEIVDEIVYGVPDEIDSANEADKEKEADVTKAQKGAVMPMYVGTYPGDTRMAQVEASVQDGYYLSTLMALSEMDKLPFKCFVECTAAMIANDTLLKYYSADQFKVKEAGLITTVYHEDDDNVVAVLVAIDAKDLNHFDIDEHLTKHTRQVDHLGEMYTFLLTAFCV